MHHSIGAGTGTGTICKVSYTTKIRHTNTRALCASIKSQHSPFTSGTELLRDKTPLSHSVSSLPPPL